VIGIGHGQGHELGHGWSLNIRFEVEADAASVFAVNEQAFERPDEARLVERLRREADPYIGLVALRNEEIVGHIAFTPVAIEGWEGHPRAAGLAPLAVMPAVQREGIGSALARAGLAECRARGFALVVVLGDPEYYARFGFEPASARGIANVYDAPAGAFRVLELQPGALHGARGTVHYHEAFNAV
jgi:putative acetyltransferase